MGFCTFLAMSMASDGIRCQLTKGRVNVPAEQWEIVRDAFLSRDVKRIAPFVSEQGITETSMSRFDFTKTKIQAFSHLTSKKDFLNGIAILKVDESNYTVFTGAGTPGLIFAYFWLSIGPQTRFIDEKRLLKPATSVHHRSDVWWSIDPWDKSHFAHGRLRFINESGWLKVAEMKVFLPVDP